MSGVRIPVEKMRQDAMELILGLLHNENFINTDISNSRHVKLII
jgi:hypothetical protein